MVIKGLQGARSKLSCPPEWPWRERGSGRLSRLPGPPDKQAAEAVWAPGSSGIRDSTRDRPLRKWGSLLLNHQGYSPRHRPARSLVTGPPRSGEGSPGQTGPHRRWPGCTPQS